MGAIYKVRHRLLDEIRVVKVMRPQVLANEELKKRFVEEAKTATRLKHPNICTIHDFALDEDGTAYLVMEFIDGVTLAELGRTLTPVPVTIEIAEQSLQALGYLHRRNVVHRDIAPDNLMLTTDEEGRPLVKLIDLGIAKALDRPGDMTSTGVFLGKLKYASPEQYGALPPGEKIDGRSDLYCLGVVLYELLTGTRPFVGDTPAEMLRAHLFQPPLPFEQSDPTGRVPQELRTVILKTLEKRREDRYASAEDFARDLEGVRDHLGSHDAEDTIAFVSNARETRDVGGIGITPSAQDRLDRRFGVQKTPSPSSTTRQPKRPSSEVTDPGLAKTTTLTPKIRPVEGILPPLEPLPESRAIPAPRAPTGPTLAAPIARKRRPLGWLLVGGIAAAAVLAGFVLLRSRGEPAPGEPSAAAAPTAEPASGVAANPTPEVTVAIAAAAVPTEAAPVPTSAPPTQAVAPATRAPAPTPRPRPTPEPRRTVEVVARVQEPVQPIRIPPTSLPAAIPTALPPPTAAPTAMPRPTSLPAVVEAPVGDADRIRDAIRRWERAQNTLDADAYARAFPRVDKSRIQTAFDGLRSQTVSYDVIRVDVTPGSSRATVVLFERRVAVPRVGNEQRAEGNRTVTLTKSGDGWVITEVQ